MALILIHAVIILAILLAIGLTIPLCVAGFKARKEANLGRYTDAPSSAMAVIGAILSILSLVVYTCGFFANSVAYKTPVTETSLFNWLLRATPMVLMFVHFVGFHGRKPALLPGIALLFLGVAYFQTVFSALRPLITLQGTERLNGYLISQSMIIVFSLTCACPLLMGSVPILISGSKRHGKVPALIGLFFAAGILLLSMFANVAMLIADRSVLAKSNAAFQLFTNTGFLPMHIVLIVYLFGKTKAPAVAPPQFVPVAPVPNIPVPPIPVAPPEPEQPKPAVPAFCPYCGAKRTPGHSFCGSCGQKFS